MSFKRTSWSAHSTPQNFLHKVLFGKPLIPIRSNSYLSNRGRISTQREISQHREPMRSSLSSMISECSVPASLRIDSKALAMTSKIMRSTNRCIGRGIRVSSLGTLRSRLEIWRASCLRLTRLKRQRRKSAFCKIRSAKIHASWILNSSNLKKKRAQKSVSSFPWHWSVSHS